MQRLPESEETISQIIPIGKKKLTTHCVSDISVANHYTSQVIKFSLVVTVRKMIPVSELPILVRAFLWSHPDLLSTILMKLPELPTEFSQVVHMQLFRIRWILYITRKC